MGKKTAFISAGLLLAAVILSSTGCGPIILGPNLGALGYPIPVSPYFQKKEEDAFWNHKRYDRVPILGPLQPGAGNRLRRPVGRRSHAQAGEGPAGAGWNSLPARSAAEQGPHRLRADSGQHRSAPRDAHWSAPCRSTTSTSSVPSTSPRSPTSAGRFRIPRSMRIARK